MAEITINGNNHTINGNIIIKNLGSYMWINNLTIAGNISVHYQSNVRLDDILFNGGTLNV